MRVRCVFERVWECVRASVVAERGVVWCSVVQCGVVRCGVLQCVAVCCSVLIESVAWCASYLVGLWVEGGVLAT